MKPPILLHTFCREKQEKVSQLWCWRAKSPHSMAWIFPHQRVSVKAGIPRKRNRYFHTVLSWNMVCLCSSTLSRALQNSMMHIISQNFSGTQLHLVSLGTARKNLKAEFCLEIGPACTGESPRKYVWHVKYVSRLTYPFVYKATFSKADTEALPITTMVQFNRDPACTGKSSMHAVVPRYTGFHYQHL